MRIASRLLMGIASLSLGLVALTASAQSKDLETCQKIAQGQQGSGCQVGSSKQNAECKTDMGAAQNASSASACWNKVETQYPKMSSTKLATCVMNSIKLYAESGGNKDTSSEVYKSLMAAFKDTNESGGTCTANYTNAINAWAKKKTAAAAAATPKSIKWPLTDCNDAKKVPPTAKALCEADMQKRNTCNATNDPKGCYCNVTPKPFSCN